MIDLLKAVRREQHKNARTMLLSLYCTSTWYSYIDQVPVELYQQAYSTPPPAPLPRQANLTTASNRSSSSSSTHRSCREDREGTEGGGQRKWARKVHANFIMRSPLLLVQAYRPTSHKRQGPQRRMAQSRTRALLRVYRYVITAVNVIG